ncbi:MAG: enoyl-CoA hydratase/isomerase family protein [Bdellovibrionales bacterium]
MDFNSNVLTKKPVLFSVERFGERGLGVITINRPEVLNSLNSECYELIEPQLQKWEKESEIAAIFIEGAGEKAFCAGGDVKSLVLAINSDRKKNSDPLSSAKDFFTKEYFVDYYIHQYSKPIIVLADGITMGGGIGLMNGASHRIVTERTVMAMPEVAIGLFPDVGATYFLRKLKDNFGVFMGITGARISGADAVEVGLADYFLDSKLKRKVRADVLKLPWTGVPESDRKILSQYFSTVCAFRPEAVGYKQFCNADDAVSDLFKSLTSYSELEEGFRNLNSTNEFIRDAQKQFQSGSQLSRQIFFHAIQRHAKQSLKEVFIAEWDMAIHASKGSEFIEGVRAVLIDKDQNPKWTNDFGEIESYFKSGEENLLKNKIKSLLG